MYFSTIVTALSLVVLLGGFASGQVPITFGSVTNLPTFSGSAGAVDDIATGDLDGDCDFDIVTVDQFVPLIKFHFNIGGGVFPAPTWFGTSNCGDPHRVLLADLDGDGLADLVTNRRLYSFQACSLAGFGHRVDIRLNGGAGVFPQTPSSSVQLPSRPTVLAAGDMDGDGDTDIVAGESIQNQPTGSIHVLVNDGSGGFSIGTTLATPAFTTTMLPTFYIVQAIDLADIDGNGSLDIVTVLGPTPTTRTIRLYRNSGGLSFTASALYSPGTGFGDQLTDVEATDIDGDGDVDIAFPTDQLFVTALNDGAGNFVLGYIYGVSSGLFIRGLKAVDLDRDGDTDFICELSVSGAASISIFRNDGGGMWQPPAPALPWGTTIRPADVNGNGYPDLVFLANNEQLATSINTTPGAPIPPPTLLGTSVNGGPFDASPKTFWDNDSVAFGTDISAAPCLFGKPAAILINLPPESSVSGAVTPLSASLSFPGLSIVWPFSLPSGTVIVAGDSLGFTSPIFAGVAGIVDLGFGSLALGDPPFVITIPPAAFPAGFLVRMQGIYFHPVPANLLTFGLVATNPVTLMANP